MKQEIMKKWVDALRSGAYVQGVGELRSESNMFCCLGVLCNLHAQEHPDFAATQIDSTYAGESEVTPKIVMNWSGLKSSTGDIDDTFYTTLAELNDTGKTFAEIADIIEKNWEKL